MGMAASQARYLGLTARKTNLEYQGQQINQERTILSQQCTALYNSLLSLNIPTPPSTSDYTTIEYSGSYNATDFKIGMIRPKGKKYSVEIKTTQSGDSIEALHGTSIVTKPQSGEAAKIMGRELTAEEIEQPITNIGAYYVYDPVSESVSRVKVGIDVIKDGDSYKFVTGKRFVTTIDGNTEYHNADADRYQIAGNVAYTWAEAEAMYPSPTIDWGRYETAIKNRFSDEGYKKEDFYVFFTVSDSGRIDAKLALKGDVEDLNDRCNVYEYSTGTYTETKVYDECELNFDTSGRLTTISIPNYDDPSHPEKITSYIDVNVEATKVTDDKAYKEAYAQYEYAQYEYDKKQQEINAKTEVIQQEDKNLELKLTRLDNERHAIETELDSVKNVIEKNIDKSFKAFSG